VGTYVHKYYTIDVAIYLLCLLLIIFFLIVLAYSYTAVSMKNIHNLKIKGTYDFYYLLPMHLANVLPGSSSVQVLVDS